MPDDSKLIAIDQLRIGMYIKLDLNWFQHSFSMNAFKITNAQQISEIKALKLKHIRYIPSKSDLDASSDPGEPLPEANADTDTDTDSMTAAAPSASPGQARVFDTIIEAKRARFEKLKAQRDEIARCEEKFVQAATVIKNLNKNIFSQPEATIKEAGKLVDSIADSILGSNDTVMHLIQNANANEEIYFHNLNVSVLSMMLASEMKCSDIIIKSIGMAALFHDLGKIKVPDKILLKLDPLTKPELDFFKLHTQYGVDVGKKAGLPNFVMEVIANHHEYLDGTGYPRQLKGDAVRLPTRIVTIANVYDNLCNHVDPRQSLTPHEALSTMYAHRRAQFDPLAMATMVKSLGVYPPGTLVRLSNEVIGLVLNVNVGKPLRPRILVYDADTPKEDAIILDLAEEGADLAVSASIRPGALPKAIFDYLNPRSRVNYFVDAKSTKTPPNAKAANR